MFSVVGTTFEVLAEPNRRRILDALLAAPRSVTELVDELRLSQPPAGSRGWSRSTRASAARSASPIRPERRQRRTP
jgi:hypothetical protein